MKRIGTLGLQFVGVFLLIALIVGARPMADHTAEAQGGTLTYGDSVFGVLEADGTTQLYTFAGVEHDQVTVDVFRMSAGLAPTVTLRAADGTELAQSVHDRLTDGGRNAHLAYVLPQSATYTLEVRAEEGAGNFMLRLQGRAQAVALEMQYGVSVEVDVPQNAPPQYYTFEAQHCATTLTVTNLTEGEPFTFPFAVTLRNEDGQEVARLRGGVAHEDRVTVAAESGVYEVEVRASDPTVTGRLALLVTCASGAPDCGGGAGAECPACPSCPEEWGGDSGITPSVCENIHVTATLHDDGSAEIAWEAVPGADHYWIHMYGYVDDDENYFGASGATGEATSITLPHLFDGFWGFRFVVEAVDADGNTICVGEDEFLLATEERTCDDFHVTGEVLSNEERTAIWNWTAYPGVTFYGAVLAYDADGVLTFFSTDVFDAATTSVTTVHPIAAADSDTWTLLIAAIDEDDALVCSDQATVTFEREIEQMVPPTCSITLLSPREGMTNGMQPFYWMAVAGATGYRVRVYNESGALVAEGVVGAGVNSLILDVSTATIGGGFSFYVTVEALLGDATWCQDGVTELRAAENPGGDGGSSGGNPQCYYVTTLAEPSSAGYAAPNTPANCGNGYAAGTNVQVEAHPNAGCWLNNWDGCGASGNANPVTITVNGDCTITAHLGCIQ